MPFPIIIFLIFMVLKLTGYIDWSWWFISIPIVVFVLALAHAEGAKRAKK